MPSSDLTVIIPWPWSARSRRLRRWSDRSAPWTVCVGVRSD